MLCSTGLLLFLLFASIIYCKLLGSLKVPLPTAGQGSVWCRCIAAVHILVMCLYASTLMTLSRLEEQARRTVEHQGAAETLGDPNRPSQLKVRFDDLYHNASVSLADALLPDTESSETRSRHSPERRINQFLCRLFMVSVLC